MIVYQPTRDLSASAQITYNNMRTYYEYSTLSITAIATMMLIKTR